MFKLALAAQTRSSDKTINIIRTKTVMTSNTEIKHGDPGERTISIVDMGADSTYLQSRQPGCQKTERILLP